MKRRLQVFVSSTYSDLIPERQAAVAAILKSGHIPAGMELFAAGDQSQMDTIKRWIDESDVYMLILGGRYGTVELKTGLSYTELEYDYAVAQGIPNFAVVIRESALEERVKKGGTKLIERIEPKALEQFREKILSNISSFFDDEKDIRLCVYESMSEFEANPDLKGWVSAVEAEDSKALRSQLAALKEENASLSAELAKTKDKLAASRSGSGSELSDIELKELLRAIEIKVPKELMGGKEHVTNLLQVAFDNRDTLISGVTNGMNANPAETFFYFNIMPKLQTYGLAEIEKVPGARYRRSFLNKTGQKFFGWVEREQLLKDKIKKSPRKEDGTQKAKPEPPNAEEDNDKARE